jgi:hypothetical protein
VDYEETFSLVVGYTSIRVVISLVSFMGWMIHHMMQRQISLMGSLRRNIHRAT